MTNLTEKTTTTEFLNKLVTSKSNRHRNNSSRTISLNDIIGVRLSRGITVTVVEDSIIGLVDPLPQNDIESLSLIMNNSLTVEGARSIPIWIGMLAGTKQDILPIGLIISLVWGCSIDSMILRAFQSSASLYLFSPFFQDSILATASSWAFLPRTTFLPITIQKCYYLKSQRIKLYFTRPQ